MDCLTQTIFLDENLPDLQKKLKSKNFKDTLEIIQSKNKRWTKSYKDRALQCKKKSQVSFFLYIYYRIIFKIQFKYIY
jgi:hypothetical protein